MIPAFNPGPNPYGPPPVFLGGFGLRMIELGGEVADGFLAHPFNTRRSLQQNVLPALERGLAKSGPQCHSGHVYHHDGDLQH